MNDPIKYPALSQGLAEPQLSQAPFLHAQFGDPSGYFAAHWSLTPYNGISHAKWMAISMRDSFLAMRLLFGLDTAVYDIAQDGGGSVFLPDGNCPPIYCLAQIAESLVSSAERTPGTEVPVPLYDNIPPHKILAQAQKIAVQRGLAGRYVSFYTSSGASVLVTTEA